jgi:hypothetical protein
MSIKFVRQMALAIIHTRAIIIVGVDCSRLSTKLARVNILSIDQF